MGQLRLLLAFLALAALAIGGPLLSGSIAPTVNDRDHQCNYNAAEDTRSWPIRLRPAGPLS